ncbi:hypothetical protein C8R47DRAFT_1082136 [Mycena vitilis]|nr:hypothetical protein C8R47DRAFT_1082136 [Mycena vitilis]
MHLLIELRVKKKEEGFEVASSDAGSRTQPPATASLNTHHDSRPCSGKAEKGTRCVRTFGRGELNPELTATEWSSTYDLGNLAVLYRPHPIVLPPESCVNTVSKDRGIRNCNTNLVGGKSNLGRLRLGSSNSVTKKAVELKKNECQSAIRTRGVEPQTAGHRCFRFLKNARRVPHPIIWPVHSWSEKQKSSGSGAATAPRKVFLRGAALEEEDELRDLNGCRREKGLIYHLRDHPVLVGSAHTLAGGARGCELVVVDGVQHAILFFSAPALARPPAHPLGTLEGQHKCPEPVHIRAAFSALTAASAGATWDEYEGRNSPPAF